MGQDVSLGTQRWAQMICALGANIATRGVKQKRQQCILPGGFMEPNISPESRKSERVKTVRHAFNTLNDALQDSSDDLEGILSKDYRHIKGTLKGLGPDISRALHEIRDASKETLVHAKDEVIHTGKDAARVINHTARRNPWKFAGIAAAVGSVVGFLAGRKSKNSDIE